MTTIDSAQDYPIVALSLQTSGIHPSSAHIVRISALTSTSTGEIGHYYEWLLNPQDNPGPQHLHGATRAEISQAPRFSSVLKQLDTLIDRRTLVVHNAARTWGFIVSDARRAMSHVARMNRHRNRGRKRSVGRVPEPTTIVDTLASWRRLGNFGSDTRIRAVATSLGCTDAYRHYTPLERAAVAASDLAKNEVELLLATYLALGDAVVHLAPGDLQADPFGLQRHHTRVAAMVQTPAYPNPGIYSPETGLIAGMEVAIAPEITVDATTLIERMQAAQLTYTEKMTRTASLVVCNKREDLVGKAMHAQRKGIPLLSDAEFLAALDAVREPTAAELAAAPEIPRTPRLRAPKSVLKKRKNLNAQRGGASGNASGNAGDPAESNASNAAGRGGQSGAPAKTSGGKQSRKSGGKNQKGKNGKQATGKTGQQRKRSNNTNSQRKKQRSQATANPTQPGHNTGAAQAAQAAQPQAGAATANAGTSSGKAGNTGSRNRRRRRRSNRNSGGQNS